MTVTHLPDPVRTVLDGFVTAAQRALGDDLRSIVLYGSAAEGRMRTTSDVNVILVLHRFEKERVDALREPFRFASSAVALQAMFLLSSEINDASREFAQKFADILRRRQVLHGDDPFAALTIPRDALVRRTQQVLLNLSLRLRESYVMRSLREEQAARTIADAAGPLRTSAATLIELETGEILPPKEALERVVRELGRAGFSELLPHISEAREQGVTSGAAGLLFTTLELAGALHDRAHRL